MTCYETVLSPGPFSTNTEHKTLTNIYGSKTAPSLISLIG